MIPSCTAYDVSGLLGPALSLVVLFVVAFSVVGSPIVLVLRGKKIIRLVDV